MSDPKCPWCGSYLTGHSFLDEEENHDGDKYEVECAECGKPINITVEVEIYYSAKKGTP